MNVYEVLAQTAFLLGNKALCDDIENSTATAQEEIATLLRCYNLVENEIALDYLPLTVEERVSSSDGKCFYTAFSKTPISILSVTDDRGNKLPYEIFPEYLTTSAGDVYVTYTYAPESKNANSPCSYSGRVSKRLLAYGVATEYCLINGLYEEAVMWDKKYKDALLCISSANKPKIVRARRWV